MSQVDHPRAADAPTPIIPATEDHPAIYRDGHRLTATPTAATAAHDFRAPSPDSACVICGMSSGHANHAPAPLRESRAGEPEIETGRAVDRFVEQVTTGQVRPSVTENALVLEVVASRSTLARLTEQNERLCARIQTLLSERERAENEQESLTKERAAATTGEPVRWTVTVDGIENWFQAERHATRYRDDKTQAGCRVTFTELFAAPQVAALTEERDRAFDGTATMQAFGRFYDAALEFARHPSGNLAAVGKFADAKAEFVAQLEGNLRIAASLSAAMGAANDLFLKYGRCGSLCALNRNVGISHCTCGYVDAMSKHMALPAGDAPRVKFEVDPTLPPGEMRVKQDGKTVLRVVGLDADTR